MNTLLKGIALSMAAVFVALATSGCNTTRGLGEDIQSLGEGIERSANSAKRY